MGARQCVFAYGFLGFRSRRIPSDSFDMDRGAPFVRPSGEKPFQFDLKVEKVETYNYFLGGVTIGWVVENLCLFIEHFPNKSSNQRYLTIRVFYA